MTTTTDNHYIPPAKLRIFRDESQNLCAEIKDRGTWQKVAARLAFPYSDAERFILLSLNDEEIGMVRELSELDPVSRNLLADVLKRRYHTPEIQRILSVYEAQNAMIWQVETDRGQRELLVRDRHNFRRLKNGDFIIIDVDGNRFRVSGSRRFDGESQKLLDLHS